MGAIHHRISTANRDAQKFFDQGLALVYAFNFGEAIDSFQRASNWTRTRRCPTGGSRSPRDRTTTPGQWAAIANGRVSTPSRPPSDSRRTLRSRSGPTLTRWLAAFTDDPHPDQPKLGRDYSNAMREVHRRYPDDPDAAALFAASLMNLNPWHLWKIDGRPGPDTPEIVAVLEDALRRWPEHTGVNHFYIHAMEGSSDPERALPSAHRLETLAPAAGHLVHMPSHIYLRTGDYAAAVRSNQQAIAADRNYLRRQPAAAARSHGVREPQPALSGGRGRHGWRVRNGSECGQGDPDAIWTTRRWPP